MAAAEWDDGRPEVADSALVPPRLASMPSRLLGRAASRADRLSTAALASVGSHRWQYVVLLALADGGSASQSTISRRTGVHRSDLVGVINSLTAAGQIRREADPADRRRQLIVITRSGRARLRTLERLVDQVQDQLLARLSAAERAELVRLLLLIGPGSDSEQV